LLTPRIGDRAGVESIKPGVFDEGHRHGAIVLAVNSHREGYTVRASSRLAQGGEGARPDRVPRLGNWATDLPGDPLALGLPAFDRRNFAVTLGIIVGRVDDHRFGGHVCEQWCDPGDGAKRRGHDHHINPCDRLRGGDRTGTVLEDDARNPFKWGCFSQPSAGL